MDAARHTILAPASLSAAYEVQACPADLFYGWASNAIAIGEPGTCSIEAAGSATTASVEIVAVGMPVPGWTPPNIDTKSPGMRVYP